MISLFEIDFFKLEEVFRWKKNTNALFIKEEFSCNSFFEKIFLLIVSCYCISTEVRYINEVDFGEKAIKGTSLNPLPES